MRLALLLSIALFSTGCFRMTIVNGSAEAAATPAVDDKWRSTTVLDVVAIDAPLALDATCKETPWARIEQRLSVLDYLVDVFLAGWVYESTHVDVYCAKSGGTPTAPTVANPQQ
jgi:hypothetical protein